MKTFIYSIVICMAAFGSSQLFAGGAVIRALTIKTDMLDQYLAEIEQGKKIMQKLNAKTELKVWVATYSGSDTGTVVVTLEWPDIETMAADDSAQRKSEEFMNWRNALSKIRTIESDSLYTRVDKY